MLPTDGLNVPARHGMHDDAEVLPGDGLYVPAGHGMHDEEKLNGLYVPAAHAVHDVAPLPDKLLKVPGAHLMQPKPFKFTTEPASQKGQRGDEERSL